MRALPPKNESPINDSQNMGKVMSILAWILTLLLLALFFSHWSKRQNIPQSHFVNVNGELKTIINRNNRNQYLIEGSINHQSVIFLLDTGATEIVIPGKLTEKLGLKRGPEALARTAGGEVTVYLTRIPELVIGNIKLFNVSANINPQMQGEEILFGMSGINKINISQENDKLTLSFPEHTKSRSSLLQ